MTRTTVLTNIANALANEGSIERNGQVIKGIATQLGYAGIKVYGDDLTQALDAVSVEHPSTFNTMPPLSTHYGPYGLEYRLRPTTEVRDATQACVVAVYEVTDTMDRTMVPVEWGEHTVHIETIRPRAFAISMGHLRVRWAGGNFTTPRPSTIRRWVGIA